jgi:transposase
MEQIISSQARDFREGRRLRARELKQAGWNQKAIAEALGVTPGAVSQWMKRARQPEGALALLARKPDGATPRLSDEQKGHLLQMLLQGAQAFGFRGDVWTQARVAQVIQQEWGVSYHPSSISRLLKSCGWSRQKPIGRARQRNQEAIERWKEERWPQLKKSARRKDALPSL